MFRFRSIVVCIQLLVALIATTNAALGCDHCWHHLSETKSGNIAVDQAGDDSSGDTAEHVCVCSCSHGFTLPEIMPKDLDVPVSPPETAAPSYRTIPQSPPALPPRA